VELKLRRGNNTTLATLCYNVTSTKHTHGTSAKRTLGYRIWVVTGRFLQDVVWFVTTNWPGVVQLPSSTARSHHPGALRISKRSLQMCYLAVSCVLCHAGMMCVFPVLLHLFLSTFLSVRSQQLWEWLHLLDLKPCLHQLNA
jgi:hypothetical protein